MPEVLTAEKWETLRAAQQDWKTVPVSRRLKILRPLRMTLATEPERFANAIDLPQRHATIDSIASEILPLADACRFLEQHAKKLLRSRRLGISGRPLWLWGARAQVHRDPRGVVLIIGPWNYPLLLTGTQTLQALIAGNAVLLKSGQNSSAVMEVLKEVLDSAGLPPNVLTVLPEDPEAAQDAIRRGVDYTVLTGSAGTGRNVLHQLADTLTPAAMELSGCDALFALPEADLKPVAKALAFGLRFNSSATCIAPRRVFVPRGRLQEFEQTLRQELSTLPDLFVPESAGEKARTLAENAIQQGAKLWMGSLEENPASDAFPLIVGDVTANMKLAQADVFAPVAAILPYEALEEALAANRECPYALGASVFGPRLAAEQFAQRVEAGAVVVNDLIAPTADPRLGFGGRRQSGFGRTRGVEGLLSMTVEKAIITSGGPKLHFRPASKKIENFIRGYLKIAHGIQIRHRFQGLWDIIRGVFTK